MSIIKIGLLGFGTVSAGFYNRLEAVRANLCQQTGLEARVEKVLVRREEAEKLAQLLEGRLVYDFNDILNDPEIHVVVEAISGAEPAGSYIEAALLAGKHVITANKAAVASRWNQLHEAAESGGAELYYEASVCAGIPLIQVLKTISQSDRIVGLEAIVNGTSNYILTAMAESHAAYEEALSEAQRLGYAEADPTADVDGWDAANKLSILCGLAFGEHLSPQELSRDSLRGLDSAKQGFKLIASAKREGGRLRADVSLVQLSPEHPLYSVNGVDNGVVLTTEGIGQLQLFGPGAGGFPTGTAMVSDLYQLIQKLKPIQ